jgi:hypothetical protein
MGFFVIAFTMVSFRIQAADLAQIRQLNDEISAMTGGRIVVLNKNFADLYDTDTVVKLTTILAAIKNDPNLQMKTPAQVGRDIVNQMAVLSDFNDYYVNQKILAENKFCKLSLEPANLFSPAVTAGVCRIQPEAAAVLFKSDGQ